MTISPANLIRGVFGMNPESPEVSHSCPALGETIIGPVKIITSTGHELFRVEEMQCILTGYDTVSLVIHLNDQHKWTRNQIADWLETLDLDLTFPGVADV